MDKINLIFDIQGQEIRRKDTNIITGNTIGFVKCTFNFDKSWNGLTKTAVFENMLGNSYDVLLGVGDTALECDFASDALSSTDGIGVVYVSVKGIALDGSTVTTRALTERIEIPLKQNGALNGSENQGVTPTVPEQVVNALAKSQWITGTAITGTDTDISAEIENAVCGMHYINETTSNVYVCTAVEGEESTWDYICSFKGKKGDNGIAGKDLQPVYNQSQFASWKISIAPGTRGVCIVTDDFGEYLQGDVISCEKDPFGTVTLIKFSIIGTDGTNGYSPVRGIDYWTNADIGEIKSYIDSQIGVIENASY